jgi:hypothetical protein
MNSTRIEIEEDLYGSYIPHWKLYHSTIGPSNTITQRSLASPVPLPKLKSKKHIIRFENPPTSPSSDSALHALKNN